MAPQVGLEPTTLRLTAECSAIELLRNKDVGETFASPTMGSGDDLPSRAVSSQVLSACGGLTSVFGMGTGGTLQLLSPEIVYRFQGDAPGPRLPASALYRLPPSLLASAFYGIRLCFRLPLLRLPPSRVPCLRAPLSLCAPAASALRFRFAPAHPENRTGKVDLDSTKRTSVRPLRLASAFPLPLRFASGLFSRLQIKPSTD